MYTNTDAVDQSARCLIVEIYIYIWGVTWGLLWGITGSCATAVAFSASVSNVIRCIRLCSPRNWQLCFSANNAANDTTISNDGVTPPK